MKAREKALEVHYFLDGQKFVKLKDHLEAIQETKKEMAHNKQDYIDGWKDSFQNTKKQVIKKIRDLIKELEGGDEKNKRMLV